MTELPYAAEAEVSLSYDELAVRPLPCPARPADTLPPPPPLPPPVRPPARTPFLPSRTRSARFVSPLVSLEWRWRERVSSVAG